MNSIRNVMGLVVEQPSSLGANMNVDKLGRHVHAANVVALTALYIC